MKQSSSRLGNIVTAIFAAFGLAFCTFSASSLDAQSNTAEKKVDYLEQIYFSGENKEGLNTKILIALQQLQDNAPTPSLAKQVTFLLDIKDKANEADDACDILDLLAVGIYNIDAAEAEQQGVRMPSEKAKTKTVDALGNLTKLNSTSNNLSSSASNLAWSSYLLGGGKYSSFGAGAGKVAKTAGTVGYVAGAAEEAGQTVKQLNDVRKSLGLNFKKKDKPCNDVPKKDIQIGEHTSLAAKTTAGSNTNAKGSSNAAVSTTIINISGISSSSLRTLTDSLRNKTGVQSAEKSYSETTSTVTVEYAGNTDELADWLADKFSSEYKILNYSTGKINLALQPKK